jgi:hypothetical protein
MPLDDGDVKSQGSSQPDSQPEEELLGPESRMVGQEIDAGHEEAVPGTENRKVLSE